MSGVIYFVANASGSIKIGYSKQFEARIKDLRTTSSSPLDVICTIPGTVEIERFIHRSLKPHRQHMEWFADCDAVRAFIADLVSHGPVALGFASTKKAPRDSAASKEARMLASIIMAHAPNPLGMKEQEFLRDLEARYGLLYSIMWHLKYRPDRDVKMGQLEMLREAAPKVIRAAKLYLAGAEKIIADNEERLLQDTKRMREVSILSIATSELLIKTSEVLRPENEWERQNLRDVIASSMENFKPTDAELAWARSKAST